MYEESDGNDVELLKIIFWLVVGFIFCTYRTWSEIRYALTGRTSTARIISMHESIDAVFTGKSVRENRIQEVRLEYLDEDGKRQRQAINFPQGWRPPTNGRVSIQYLPNVSKSARWVDGVTYAYVWVWLIYIGGIAVFFIYMHRLAHEPAISFREKRRRKRLARRKKRFARYANR
ncbi:hypothetical protein [Thalassoroseus pseudoceratinae]|uniref:hypothetical protein n=1 Tax=Thalassoroseus pseudoceratinae TaxID=2713176 RepID=UPI001423D42E|nr:hypothetical protein [Thalassoroseus pseudoceratinae]